MNRYDTHDIPIDTFWTDIDYLDNYKVFTNSDKFNKKDIQSLMTKYDKKYIPILDPTISAKPYQSNGQQYSTLIEGLQSNVFLMDDTNDFPMMSKQWAGPVFVPDFLHPNCSNYWNHQLLSFKSNYLFDGLWIDMNEVSNFVNGNYNISSEIEK
jgi:alpha-glucosidase (family GH31 glycosyl hydrolase)